MRFERNLLIPLDDGEALAADLLVPEGDGPHPALISFYPYRKDDLMGSFYAYPQRRLIERGYAHLMVDLRGTGGSDGRDVELVMPQAEGADAAEVVEWAARQDWCNGAIGVWGVSYGGLMSLAVAAERPPHLRAIAPIFGLWDVYADGVAAGGATTAMMMSVWEVFMLALGLAPPTYQDREGRWLDVWRERLDRYARSGPESLRWLGHPRFDGYWAERVVDIERIQAATFIVGGWRDLFPEAMTAAYERITAPKRLLVGPWLHQHPDLGIEPIDWPDQLARWFDRWLRGDDSAGDAEVTVYVQGRGWRRLPAWPPPGRERLVLHPTPGGGLGDRPPHGADDELAQGPVAGAQAGLYDPLGLGVGFPLDQGPDDLASLTYTSEPLGEALEIAGSPRARLAVSGPGEQLQLVVKLVDVGPDGSARLVTTGWLRPETAAGEHEVTLWPTAYSVAAGHRVRMSVAASDFPRVWPLPGSARFRVGLGHSWLELPVTACSEEDPDAAPPAAASIDLSERMPWLIADEVRWTTERDEVAGGIAVTEGGLLELALPQGGSFRLEHDTSASVVRDRPASAQVTSRARIAIRLAGGEVVAVDAGGRFRHGRVEFDGSVTLDGDTLLERRWKGG